MIPAIDIQENVPLAPRTTLELGGPAAYFLRARDRRSVRDALLWARRRGVPAAILGGGSNLLVDDAGFDGLVVEMCMEGVQEIELADGRVELTAEAGEDWDLFVERCVARGYAGLECLSGIPGRVGASPVQNVGAYGQEVSDTLTRVRVLERSSFEERTMSAADCELSYRDSLFKRDMSRYVVLSATFALTPDGPPTVRYAELRRAIEAAPGTSHSSLSSVREEVVRLRRRKSMVLDFADDNHRSAGSFFTNPIVAPAVAERVIELALGDGVVDEPSDVPRWPQADGRVKLAAGWLVERAGMAKGTRRGRVGISTKHALALVHHGGGTTRALLTLADEVRAAVRERFGVELEIEPRRLGE